MGYKFVGSANCRCKGVGRGGVGTFFTKLVPFVDCSDKKRVSKLFCLACRYNVSSLSLSLICFQNTLVHYQQFKGGRNLTEASAHSHSSRNESQALL